MRGRSVAIATKNRALASQPARPPAKTKPFASQNDEFPDKHHARDNDKRQA
jgi:hypothetical protein